MGLSMTNSLECISWSLFLVLQLEDRQVAINIVSGSVLAALTAEAVSTCVFQCLSLSPKL